MVDTRQLANFCVIYCSGLIALLAPFSGWVLITRPRQYVDVNFSCSYPINDQLPVLPGIPFRCGWHELRPGSKEKIYAFIQPTGSMCQSNAGYVRGNRSGAGVLIDTLTDPVLTKGMLDSLPETAVGERYPLTAVVYTHADIDHISGDQVVPREVPRIGHSLVNDEIRAIPSQRFKLEVAIAIGHFVWGFAEALGWKPIVRSLPETAQRAALTFLGWAHVQASLAKFSIHAIRFDPASGLTRALPSAAAAELAVEGVSSPLRFEHIGALHSKSDSVVLLPAARVCFAGDLLFVGIAPIMWAGTAAAWAAALDALLARTGSGWIFVPGHGPPTDAAGVRRVRDYLAHLDAAVTALCPDPPTPGGGGGGGGAEGDYACAVRVYSALPPALRAGFAEPERILISAQVERMARRAGGRVAVDVTTKVLFFSRMGAESLRLTL